VILAGGQARRLGVASKALAPLAGKPLIQHVLERLAGQAEPILVSVQAALPALGKYGHEQVVDIVQRHRGPLVGLCSAMQRLAGETACEWLLLCPCDAPFLPGDLAVRLYRSAEQEQRPVSVAKYQDVLQPTFSLWNMGLYPAVSEAVMARGGSGLWQVLRELPYAEVEWAVRDLPPFFNINTPHDLDRAARLADGGGQASRGQ
jgi:molybdopterin-guanine dinucleotide biosynthesis protein A